MSINNATINSPFPKPPVRNIKQRPIQVGGGNPDTKIVPETKGFDVGQIGDFRNKKTNKSIPEKSQSLVNHQAEISQKLLGSSSKTPELTYGQRKERLEKLGVKWSDPNNHLSEKEEMKLMKDLEGYASKIPSEKRPDISVFIRGNSGADHRGLYHPTSNKLELFTTDEKGVKSNELPSTLSHEYGHAVADKVADKKFMGGVRSGSVEDSKGRNLYERASKLEKGAEKAGHEPAKIYTSPVLNEETIKKLKGKIPDDKLKSLESQMKSGASLYEAAGKAGLGKEDFKKALYYGGTQDKTVYDKYDPYGPSQTYTEKGRPQEKYARADRHEHYAETFEAYTKDPEEFRNKIRGMEDKLKSGELKPEERKYMTESLDILKESYGYFRNKIFNGQQFGKNQFK